MNPSIQKELDNADKFRENIEKTSFWRLAAIIKNGRFCRDSLDKAFALSGHTGNPIFDLWVYIVQALPWFIPTTIVLIPGLFTALIAFVSGALSVVKREPKIIQKTVEIPFLWIFKTTTTISETVLVPVIHAPSFKISAAVSIIIILIATMMISVIIKIVFLYELNYRRNLLIRHIERKG